MKKTLTVLSLLAVLALGSCSRRANCPAYGHVAKPAPSAAVRA